jgi:hypothetical protein
MESTFEGEGGEWDIKPCPVSMTDQSVSIEKYFTAIAKAKKQVIKSFGANQSRQRLEVL